MEVSKRIGCILNLVDKCNILADIGSDHAYVPISAIKQEKCSYAIASDINKGPIEKAKKNVIANKLEDKIQCRLGGGLTTLKENEVDLIIVAGMGGNLIRDIIEERINVFSKLDYAILQPTQNPEVLRKYLIENGYEIVQEDLCYEDNIYYEMIKVKCEKSLPKKLEEIYYEISEKLLCEKHPMLKEYIEFKIMKNRNILGYINGEGESVEKRRIQIRDKIYKMEEILKCL